MSTQASCRRNTPCAEARSVAAAPPWLLGPRFRGGSEETEGGQGGSARSGALDGYGEGLAAADAQAGHAALLALLLEGVHQRDDDARPGGADGVALGAGAAVDLDPLVVGAALRHGQHGDDGEGRVAFS